MTDITFAFFCSLSVLLLYLAFDRGRVSLMVLGLVMALFAVLCRQIGIVIPVAFVVALIVVRARPPINPLCAVLLSILLIMIPWICYESFLDLVGSTSVAEHDVFTKIFRYPMEWGFAAFGAKIVERLGIALAYTSFLAAPLLVFFFRPSLLNRPVIIFAGVWTLLFAGVELSILTGMIDPPTGFHRNLIHNFGIGPILLKDTYILNIDRGFTLSKPFYYLLVYFAGLMFVLMARYLQLSLGSIIGHFLHKKREQASFSASFALALSASYLGVIALTGFHDRYLIPVSIFFIIWLCSDYGALINLHFPPSRLAPTILILCGFALFSVGGVHDFMEMKRALKKAQDHVVNEMDLRPCEFDGGFEYNGYHCYEKDFEPVQGHSWWWVSEERRLLTLGPLPNHSTLKRFPFHRYIGPDGAAHILGGENGDPERNHRSKGSKE
jgi:hypothetical protein